MEHARRTGPPVLRCGRTPDRIVIDDPVPSMRALRADRGYPSADLVTDPTGTAGVPPAVTWHAARHPDAARPLTELTGPPAVRLAVRMSYVLDDCVFLDDPAIFDDPSTRRIPLSPELAARIREWWQSLDDAEGNL